MSSLILWGLFWEAGRAQSGLTFFLPPISEVHCDVLCRSSGTPAFLTALSETATAFLVGVFSADGDRDTRLEF